MIVIPSEDAQRPTRNLGGGLRELAPGIDQWPKA